MPKIDFYILSEEQSSAADAFACRLTEKAYTLGHRIYLHTDNAASAKHLDNLLWTFRDGSFLPHEMAATTPPESPIVVGYQAVPEDQDDLLINLANTPLPELQRFSRVAEIVAGDESRRSAARERFRQYRDLGYELESHQIN